MDTKGPVPPAFKERHFNCPVCGVYATQIWWDLVYLGYQDKKNGTQATMCKCLLCEAVSLWWDGQSVVPAVSSAPLPHGDMPAETLKIYEEARDIFERSPRSAAALLRLAIQLLCETLGQGGKNLNEAIGALVSEGLPRRVQKALDTVRVVGNHAVHPGVIDFDDDRSTALALFSLTNYVVERMITEPAKIDELFEALPENAKKAIERRDDPKLLSDQTTSSSVDAVSEGETTQEA